MRHKPAAASVWRLGEERVDRERFLAPFFPGSPRHDFEALAAYESYLNDVEGGPGGGPTAPGSTSSAVQGGRSDTAQRRDERERPATAETERWEGEGGASAGRLRRRRRVSDLLLQRRGLSRSGAGRSIKKSDRPRPTTDSIA